MQRYLAISFGRAVLTMLLVSVLIFSLVRLSGNPLDVLLPDTATESDREVFARLWGLDLPYIHQYRVFLTNAMRGEFGPSFRWPGQSAVDLIRSRLGATLQLAGLGLLISVVVAIPVGVLSAVKRGGPMDRLAKIVALLGQSIPSFWLAIILIWIVSVRLGWLPTSGRGGFSRMILPSIVLGTYGLAAFVRLLRSSMLEVLDGEYIKLARLKGLSEKRVIWKHALKNAGIAPLTFFGSIIVQLVTGSVVVETIFSWPGLGQLVVDATEARDYHVVQAVALLGAFLLITMNLIVDILYSYLDPRVRLGQVAT